MVQRNRKASGETNRLPNAARANERDSTPPGWNVAGRDREFASAPNGALAILDEMYLQKGKRQHLLCLYSPTNTPKYMITLPSSVEQYPTVAYDGKQVIFVSGGRIHTCRPNGQPLWQCAIPMAKDPNAIWRPFLTDEGRTLCLFDGERTVYRYAMP
jgi:hypothetical protein